MILSNIFAVSFKFKIIKTLFFLVFCISIIGCHVKKDKIQYYQLGNELRKKVDRDPEEILFNTAHLDYRYHFNLDDIYNKLTITRPDSVFIFDLDNSHSYVFANKYYWFYLVAKTNIFAYDSLTESVTLFKIENGNISNKTFSIQKLHADNIKEWKSYVSEFRYPVVNFYFSDSILYDFKFNKQYNFLKDEIISSIFLKDSTHIILNKYVLLSEFGNKRKVKIYSLDSNSFIREYDSDLYLRVSLGDNISLGNKKYVILKRERDWVSPKIYFFDIDSNEIISNEIIKLKYSVYNRGFSDKNNSKIIDSILTKYLKAVN